MKWYAISNIYINFIKQFDNIVPNNDYGNRMKCFLGVVFKADNDICYFAPLSSYKPKFKTLNNDIDFYKIIDRNISKIYGAINLNNMIPVPETEITEVTFKNISNFRTFNSNRDKKHYWNLLKKELLCIDENSILQSAEKLHYSVINNPNSFLAKRCCNFSLLEEKATEYKNTISRENKMPSIEDVDDEHAIVPEHGPENDIELEI